MQKKFFILLLILVGGFLLPQKTFACNISKSSIENSCCNEKNSSEDKIKDCCKKNSNSQKKNCEGKCKSSICTSVPSPFSVLVSTVFELSITDFDFTDKRKIFSNTDMNISKGFHDIWTPPNIG